MKKGANPLLAGRGAACWYCHNAFRPAQIGATSFLIWESGLPLGDGHLVDLLGLLGASHVETPFDRS